MINFPSVVTLLELGVTPIGVTPYIPAVQADHVVTSDYFFPSSYQLSIALLDDIQAGLKRMAGAE